MRRRPLAACERPRRPRRHAHDSCRNGSAGNDRRRRMARRHDGRGKRESQPAVAEVADLSASSLQMARRRCAVALRNRNSPPPKPSCPLTAPAVLRPRTAPRPANKEPLCARTPSAPIRSRPASTPSPAPSPFYRLRRPSETPRSRFAKLAIPSPTSSRSPAAISRSSRQTIGAILRPRPAPPKFNPSTQAWVER